MKAKEAEKLIADLLTGLETRHGQEGLVEVDSLVGFQRSRPIYKRKQKLLLSNSRGSESLRRRFKVQLRALVSYCATYFAQHR